MYTARYCRISKLNEYVMNENKMLISDQDFEDFLTLILSRDKEKVKENHEFEELVTKIVNKVKSNLVINENGYYVTTTGMPITVSQLSFLIFLSMS